MFRFGYSFLDNEPAPIRNLLSLSLVVALLQLLLLLKLYIVGILVVFSKDLFLQVSRVRVRLQLLGQ